MAQTAATMHLHMKHKHFHSPLFFFLPVSPGISEHSVFFSPLFLLPLSLIFFFFFKFPIIFYSFSSYGRVGGIERGSTTFRFHQHTMTTVTAATCGRAPLLEDLGRTLVANKTTRRSRRGGRAECLSEIHERDVHLFCVTLYVLSALFSTFSLFVCFSFSYFLHLWCAA